MMKELFLLTFLIVFCSALGHIYTVRSLIDQYYQKLGRASHPKPDYFRNGIREKLMDFGNTTFIGNISIGTPPQYFKVIFDTGSSDFLVASAGVCAPETIGTVKAYDSSASSTYQANGTDFGIGFVSGGLDGYLSTDVVNIGGVTIDNQTFAEIEVCPLFSGAPFDGIIGLGYGRVPQGDGISTPLINMFNQQLIDTKMFSLYSIRNSKGDCHGGEIIFGAKDKTRYIGDIGYVPLTDDGYWTINVETLIVNNQSISNNTVGYVDTGTSTIVVPPENLAAVNEAIGATSSPKESPTQGSTITYYTVSCDGIEHLPNVQFILNGMPFELQSSDYILKNSPTECISLFVTVGYPFWILGQPFLRRFYSIFDLENDRIGFAKVAVKPARHILHPLKQWFED